MAKMTLAQFNAEYKLLVDQAAILEQTGKPSDAVPRYMQLVELIVGFIKSGECPPRLRPKFIAKSQGLISKIKLIQIGGTASPSSGPKPKPSGSPPPGKGNITEADFNSLPEIPQSLPDEETKPAQSPIQKGFPPANSSITPNPPSIPSSKDTSSQTLPENPPSPENKQQAMDDLIGKLKRFEDELKKMPEGVKEVKPFDFNPKNMGAKGGSVSSPNLDEFKKDTITIDVTSAEVGSNPETPPGQAESKSDLDLPFKIKGFSKDPFAPLDKSSASSQKPQKDPFAIPDQNELGSNKTNGNQCFACGNTIKPGTKICPNCGAAQN